MNIEIGNIRTAFIYQGDDLLYPNYSAPENLVLHYDFSGIKNGDVTKGVARDLSGNGNDGTLQNFGYEEGSGYLDNALIFDGIDDFIAIPKPQIDLNNFTYSEGVNVLSFRGDEVATVVDGVVEIRGRNLLPNSAFLNSTDGWASNLTTLSMENGILKILFSRSASTPGLRLLNPFSLSAGTYTFGIKGNYDNLITKTFKLHFIGGITGDYSSKGIVINSGWNYNTITFTITSPIVNSTMYLLTANPNIGEYILIDYLTLVEGSNPLVDWTPAPEDLETTTFKPLFDKKIKSALYWNRALTDEELLQVYNIQIKRISE